MCCSGAGSGMLRPLHTIVGMPPGELTASEVWHASEVAHIGTGMCAWGAVPLFECFPTWPAEALERRESIHNLEEQLEAVEALPGRHPYHLLGAPS